MHYPWYKDHKIKRVKKIIDIFGIDWFKNKSILELGACHGELGLEFANLGADVLFTDARIENLTELLSIKPDAKIQVLNQNSYYNLHRKFDLVLHLGTLWHVENWYNDLYCAIKHSDNIILETLVLPRSGNFSMPYNNVDSVYSSINQKEQVFTEVAVESRLNELGCTFTRYDESELNTYYDDVSLVYDWSVDDAILDSKVHCRRFWYIQKMPG